MAVERSPPSDLSVTAFLVELDSSDVAAAARRGRRVVEDVLAPMRPAPRDHRHVAAARCSTTATRQAYLTMTDDLASRAGPRVGAVAVATAPTPAEAVVPATTARLLGLRLGDEVTLGKETGLGGVDDAVTVVVVGTFRPRAGAEWERDPLAGAGFSAAYSDGAGGRADLRTLRRARGVVPGVGLVRPRPAGDRPSRRSALGHGLARCGPRRTRSTTRRDG